MVAFSLCLTWGAAGMLAEEPEGRAPAACGNAGTNAAVTWHVAPSGSDDSPGTSAEKPLATLAAAVAAANPGDTILVHGGTYPLVQSLTLARSGEEGRMIRLSAVPGEQVVLDGTTQPAKTHGVSVTGDWWHVSGLEVVNAGHNGFYITGSHNIIERCTAHHCRNTGISIGTSKELWPSHNLILNCDAYRNYDIANHGQHADGITAKWNIGEGNVLRGCRAWENADDGFDLWKAVAPVLIENCWSFCNGFNSCGDPDFEGNGTGFKLGGAGVPAAHRLVRCMAFRNSSWGVDQNGNSAGLTVDHNTVWANHNGAIHLKNGVLVQGVQTARNNIAFGGDVVLPADSVAGGNTWEVLPDVGPGDVMSVDFALAAAPRRADGGLPDTGLLRPVPGGRLVDRGVDTGQPFAGAAPDPGAFEAAPR